MKEDYNRIFGDQLRKYRAELSESQEDFADRFGVNRSTLSLIETGKQPPDLQLLIEFISQTKIDLYGLFKIGFQKCVILTDDIICNRPQKLRHDIPNDFELVYIPDIVIDKFRRYQESGSRSEQNSAEVFFEFLGSKSVSGKYHILNTASVNDTSEAKMIFEACQELAQNNASAMYYLYSDNASFKLLENKKGLRNFKTINSEQYIQLFKVETDYNVLKSERFYQLINEGELEDAKQYYDHDDNINHIAENSGLTPLISSIKQGNLSIIDWLLSLPEINVNAYDDHKHRLPPISHAIREELLDRDTRINIVNKLIQKGANVNEPSRSDSNWFNTPLMIACWHGELDLVKILVESGACINQQDKSNGYTPLMKAVINGHVDVVSYLLDNGADRSLYAHNSKHYMKNALDIAYDNNINGKYDEIVKLLNRE